MTQKIVGSGPQEFPKDTEIGGLLLGNHAELVVLSGDATFTQADAGKVFLNAGNNVVELPDSRTLTSGSKFTVLQSGSSSIELFGSQIVDAGGKPFVGRLPQGLDIALYPRNDLNQYRLSLAGAGNRSLAPEGFQTIGDGLLLQWGTISLSAGAQRITYPKPFASVRFHISGSPNAASNSTGAGNAAFDAGDLEGCNVYYWGTSNYVLRWFAIGL